MPLATSSNGGQARGIFDDKAYFATPVHSILNQKPRFMQFRLACLVLQPNRKTFPDLSINLVKWDGQPNTTLFRGEAMSMTEGQVYRCQNRDCGSEVKVIKPSIESNSNPRCSCGTEMKKRISNRPGVRSIQTSRSLPVLRPIETSRYVRSQPDRKKPCATTWVSSSVYLSDSWCGACLQRRVK